jgi:hypothetical protein
VIIKPDEGIKLHAFKKIHLAETSIYKNHGTLTSWNRFLLGKLLSGFKSQTFMEPKGSSPYLQGPTTILSQRTPVYNLIDRYTAIPTFNLLLLFYL